MMKFSVIAFVLLIQLYQIFEDKPSKHLSSFVVVELYHKSFTRDIGTSLHLMQIYAPMLHWPKIIWLILSCTEGWGKDICLILHHNHALQVTIWVILSCTKSWGKDICPSQNELNETHRNAI